MKNSQIKIGIIISYITTAIEILTYLIYTPLLTQVLGQSEYGVYTVVSSFVGYLSLFSCGFGSAYLRHYSIYKIEKKQKDIDGLNAMFLVVFMIMGLLAGMTGMYLALNVDTVLGHKITVSEIEIARKLMIILVVNIVLSFPISVFNAIITANECYVFQKALDLIRKLFNPILTIPLLFAGYKSVAVVMVTTCLTLLALLVNILYCFGKLHIKFDFKFMKFGLLKSIAAFSFFVLINMIVDQINWNVDKFLLIRYSGSAAVAVYGVASLINSMYMQLSTQVSSLFSPRVNLMVAQNEKEMDEKLTKLFIEVGRIQFMILNLVLFGFIVFGRYFLNHWVGAGYSNAYAVVLLLIISVTIPLIQNLGIEIQRAKNQHKFRSLVYLLIAVFNIIVSIPLARQYGEIGCAIGTAGSLLIGNGLIMNWYYHKKMGINVVRFWKSILQMSKALIPVIILACCIISFIPFGTSLQYLSGIMIFTGVYSISMWIFGLNIEEKQLLIKTMKKMREKKYENRN